MTPEEATLRATDAVATAEQAVRALADRLADLLDELVPPEAEGGES